MTASARSSPPAAHAGPFEQHAVLVTDHPGVMTWRKVEHVVGLELKRGAVPEPNPKPPRHHVPDMANLTTSRPRPSAECASTSSSPAYARYDPR